MALRGGLKALLREHAVAALFFGLLLLVAAVFRQVLAPFFLAVLIVYLIEPLVAWASVGMVRGRPVSRGLAVAGVYGVAISLTVAAGALMVPRLGEELQRIGDQAPAGLNRFRTEHLPAASRWVQLRFGGLLEKDAAETALRAAERGLHAAAERGEQAAAVASVLRPEERERMLALHAPVTQKSLKAAGQGPAVLRLTPTPEGGFEVTTATALEFEQIGANRYRLAPASAAVAEEKLDLESLLLGSLEELSAGSEAGVGRVIELGQKLAGLLASAVMTVFLAFMLAAFLSVDLPGTIAVVLGLFPARTQPRVSDLMSRLDKGLSGVVRGQLSICAVNGVLTTIGLLLLGVPFGTTLGIFAGFCSLIPIFGTFISSVPAILLGLSVSPMTGLLVLIWILAIHLVEANLLNPKILGDAAQLHPVVVIFALLAGEHTFGLFGALFAVPTASILQTLFFFAREQVAPAASPLTDASEQVPP
jgi:predicted PurR-regulated permease PerM